MGLLAFPAMLKAGYDVKISAGAVTAGGCLGILIPPSVLLIVYGAVAGVSVVQLYAGAFFPGITLALLYVGYVVVLAKWKPALMPPLREEERRVPLPPFAQTLARYGQNALVALWRAAIAPAGASVEKRVALANLSISLLPALAIAAVLAVTYRAATAPAEEAVTAGLIEAGGAVAADVREDAGAGSPGLAGVPPAESTEKSEAPSTEPEKEAAPSPGTEATVAQEPPPGKAHTTVEPQPIEQAPPSAAPARRQAPTWFWVAFGAGILMLAVIYWLWNWERLQVFKMLLASFFPLALLILAVLGTIVFGLATPTEAAAIGAFGGFVLAAIYRFFEHWQAAATSGAPKPAEVVFRTANDIWFILKESSFLTAKTSAMVCWLFVGSAIFSAAFALLGGQEIIERWVLSLNLTPVQFMILAQFIIFLLGWPLEWTEIIVIFMPIFIPLLPHFNIDPLFFGLLVALNLQTAFLSPPVAMAAFYLKGVAPPHVTLNQIFAGMMPFMAIQVIALVLLYLFPGIGLWLPSVLYGR
jgi:TRAP-type mannitol/chloroaromatic compound transport system permease large subunit